MIYNFVSVIASLVILFFNFYFIYIGIYSHVFSLLLVIVLHFNFISTTTCCRSCCIAGSVLSLSLCGLKFFLFCKSLLKYI